MALEKQRLEINFSQGLDLKSDEKQVPFGKFLRLKNTVFEKIGLLQKRNGFKQLTSLPDNSFNYLSTFNGNLTAIGSTLDAFSAPTDSWVSKGTLQPVRLSTIPLVRDSIGQSSCDAVVSPNGLVCTVFAYRNELGNGEMNYQVQDSTTGQVLISITTPANVSGPTARVFVLGTHFVILYTTLISAASHLNYIAINYNSLAVNSNVSITSAYTPNDKGAFDAVVAGNNNLYIAWNGNDGGGAIRLAKLSSTLSLSGTTVVTSTAADIICITADETTSTPVIYVGAWKSNALKAAVFDSNLNTITAFTSVSSDTISSLTASAQNGSCTFFEEIVNTYTYDTSIPTHYIMSYPMTQAGSVGSSTMVIKSVGLASKSFIYNGVVYFLTTYFSSYQPTYFLVNSSGNVIAKLAYSNGGGYITAGLPNITLIDDSVSISYLFKDLIQPVNKTQNASSSTGVYAQTGVNLAMFTLSTSDIVTSEIASSLHLTGGFLWQYDGVKPIEHSFHLYPDNVETLGDPTVGSVTAQTYFYQATYEWTDNQGNIHRSAPSVPVTYSVSTAPANFTANRTSGSPTLASISSFTGLQVGQAITGTGIPASTYILSMNTGASTITMSHNASSGSATSTTVTPTTVTSINVYVPTLRLTYKTNVKICIYRWSTAQQTYYQLSVDPLSVVNGQDYQTFLDEQADSAIVGNNILYITGGVIENIAAPAVDTIALYRSRLMVLDAEDKNLIWYSKQVIEATPVEMSDLFTIYIPPTQSLEGSSGPVTAISVMDDKLIIFKEQDIYYITGTGPDNTGANNDFSDPIFITSTVGCTNQGSIVFIPNGIIFQSNKGIWLLGRDLNTVYIGAPVEDFNDFTVLSAINVPNRNEARLTMSNGMILVYNYFFGQWSTFEGIPGITSTVFQGLHTFINSYSQVLQENPGSYLDGSTPVLMGLTTGWFNPQGLEGFERAYWMNFIGEFISPHYLVVNIDYDYKDSTDQSSIVSPDNYNLPYGEDPLYGSTYVYGGTETLEQWRIFFQRQKCEAFRINIDEIFNAAYGTAAGEGLTLSGLTMIYGGKGIYPRLPASRSTG